MLCEKIKQDFIAILKEELIPAMGCTEPIALAMQGKVYEANTGIIRDETAKIISSVGHIGRVGMQPTDQEIVKLMIEKK